MIGLANALLPVRNHAITWTSGDLLPVDSLGINFSEIRIKMQWFYSGNCIWKCRLQSVGYYSRSPVVCYETSYIQSAGDLVSGIPGSNPAFSRGTQLGSFRFEYRLPVPEHRNQQQQIRISPEPGAKVNWQWGQVGWMLADHRDGLSSSSFFILILESSVGLSASIQSAGDLVSGIPCSNPAFSRGTLLGSFRFEYHLPVPEHRN